MQYNLLYRDLFRSRLQLYFLQSFNSAGESGAGRSSTNIFMTQNNCLAQINCVGLDSICREKKQNFLQSCNSAGGSGAGRSTTNIFMTQNNCLAQINYVGLDSICREKKTSKM